MKCKDIEKQIMLKKSFLCVGLDTNKNLIPSFLLSDPDPIYTFNKAIIDATAPYCIAYKLNLAFYEAEGIKGINSFEKTVQYIKNSYSQHFVIADAKRGDIGNTAEMYAKTFFSYYDVDAVTVSPYMGTDSIMPFIGQSGKWVIILTATSNPGSQDFQFVKDSNGERLFEKVIRISKEWGDEECIMYVVGATKSEVLEDVRKLVPHNFLLVPGIGAQGGNLHDVCQYGIKTDCRLIINNSRSIIYASHGKDFAEATEEKARAMQREMSYELQVAGLVPLTFDF